jgi:hypothetical protein
MGQVDLRKATGLAGKTNFLHQYIWRDWCLVLAAQELDQNVPGQIILGDVPSFKLRQDALALP